MDRSGHGALVAPDWSADWLHREVLARLDLRSLEKDALAYDRLDAGQQARVQAEMRPLIPGNTCNAANNSIVIPPQRAHAIAQVAAHCASLFSNHPATHALRVGCAMREDTVPDAQHRRALGAFFFWTSWAAVTERPSQAMTHTQNWPYEPLVGSTATMNVRLAIIVMAGGILGTFHRLYFAGTTTTVVTLGASISALEVVPLALIGLEAYATWRHRQATWWMQRYRWPIVFFLAVNFWNPVGAGLFG